MEMYSIDDLHYNNKKVIQFSPKEEFANLASTLKSIEKELKEGSELEKNMLSFFKRNVNPKVAYKDNDAGQGKGGPRRLHVIGKLIKENGYDGFFVRLGISAPKENPLIPALQVLYLKDNKHEKYFHGQKVGSENDADRWTFDFSDRYQGQVEGVKVRTRKGISSLAAIPLINEAIISNNLLIEKYKKR